MAEELSLKLLKMDVEEWNRLWGELSRKEKLEVEFLAGADLEVAFITGARLEGADLVGARLMGARLAGADLAGADLAGANLASASLVNARFVSANLEGANLEGANLEGADLAGAQLENARLKGAGLVNANLAGAHLKGAHLKGADLAGADLVGADLVNAHLKGVNLEGADLEGAQLENARLVSAHLKGASFWHANLSEADLHGAGGLALDSCNVFRTRFGPRPSDPWSILRREYSGYRFLVHFFFLVLFIAPIVGKALYWGSMNQVQERIVSTAIAAGQVAGKVEDRARQVDGRAGELTRGKAPPMTDDARWLVYQAGAVKPCLADDCREVPVWRLVTGLDQPSWSTVLFFVLVLYNACRGFLTWRVAPLREAEERSWISPAKEDYLGHPVLSLFGLHHYVARWLLWAAVAVATINAGIWLFLTSVSVPV